MFNYSHACQTFPGVEWTGGSGIHVSFAVGAIIPVPMEEEQKIMAILKKVDYPAIVWRALQTRFGHMEWLLEEDTFKQLIMVDMYRKVRGMSTSESPDRILNPATGNWFHRIALLNPYIGGLRVWAEDCGVGTNIGFRFRIVTQTSSDEEQNVRATALKLQESVKEDATEVEQFLEICEPPTDKEVSAVAIKLEIFEE